MARLSDAQVRNARVQALRAVRRAQRALDTRNEVMERRLDRAIENKERVTIVLAQSVIDDFKLLIEKLRVLEDSLADMAQIFNATS